MAGCSTTGPSDIHAAFDWPANAGKLSSQRRISSVIRSDRLPALRMCRSPRRMASYMEERPMPVRRAASAMLTAKGSLVVISYPSHADVRPCAVGHEKDCCRSMQNKSSPNYCVTGELVGFSWTILRPLSAFQRRPVMKGCYAIPSWTARIVVFLWNNCWPGTSWCFTPHRISLIPGKKRFCMLHKGAAVALLCEFVQLPRKAG